MKSLTKMICKAMCLLFLVNCFVVLPTILNIGVNAIDSNPVDNRTYFNYRSYFTDEANAPIIDNYIVKATLDSNQMYFLGTNNIVVSYMVSDNIAIDSFEYSQTGFSVISVAIDSNNNRRINVELSCLPNQSEYYFQLNMVLADDTELTNHLYAVNNQYGSFISQFDTEHAYENYYDYAITNNIITQDQYEDIKAVQNQDMVYELSEEELLAINGNNGITPASMDPIPEGYGRLSGQFLWKDDINEVLAESIHPLRKILVKAYKKGALGNYILLNSVLTDDNGHYSIDIPSNTDVYIRVYAGDENIMVKSWGQLSGYFYQFDNTFTVSNQNTVAISPKVFDMEKRAGKAFQISQAIIIARDYANYMMNEMPSSVSVIYPCSDWAFYVPIGNMIWLSDVDEEGNPMYFYRNWDTLMHEYGHHVEMECGILFSPFLLKHENDINLADEFDNLFIGSQMGWSESWNEIFLVLAQRHYSSFLTGIYGINSENPGVDLEFTNLYLGEACELSIIGLLWDLLDGKSDYIIQIDDDNIDLTDSQFWALTTISGTTSFSDCVNNFYTIYPELIPAIAERLSWYEMAPTKATISNESSVSYSVAPQITWQAQGGSTLYPNNKFDIVVFKKNTSGEYQEIYTVEDITTTSYTFSTSQWSAIMAASGSQSCKTNKVYISIKGYNDSSLITDPDIGEWSTGPYYSEFKEVNVATTSSHSFVPTIRINDSVHQTSCSKCYQMGSWADHSYTEWAPYDESFHIEKCLCGDTGTRTMPHVVKAQGSNIGGKAPCLSCGALVDLDDNFGQIGHLSIQKYSINGSYILPNGIIVLVDEDVDAYFAGTLVFYNRDDLPETE